MKRFCCFSSVFILTFISALFLSGEGFTESALTSQNDQKSSHLAGLFLLLGENTVSDIIKDVDKNDYATETEVVTDEYGRMIALTKMMIVFKPSATPLQFEQLLDSLNATVTSSVAGTRSVVVRIPQPSSLTSYYALIEKIKAEPFVDFVWKGEIPQLTALPPNYQSEPPDIDELEHIDNHLAIRGHAAWNAAGAIDENYKPRVVIADSFGEGEPAETMIDFTIPVGHIMIGRWDGGHGYTVLGIIAGTHGHYYTTGIYPGEISLGVVDHPSDEIGQNWLIFEEIMNKLLITLTRTPGMVVVNTSIAYGCDGVGGDCIDIGEARKIASLWVEYSRQFGLESRVLHITSAGNIEPIDGTPGLVVRDARTKSPFASAARLTGLTDHAGNPLSNLTNTVVIENAINTSINGEPVTSKCLHMDSFIGGNLSGIGTYVRSFETSTGDETNIATGTSFATPQVAGLAAYLWGINHTLTPQQIKNLLIATSNSVPVLNDPECSDWGAPAPIIDAYEALLALDAVSAQNSVNSPVRFSVLDVNGDDSFDENDLQLFVDKYYDTSGAEPILIEPAVPEYSRYDLNGDGWTGGSKTASFDLDRIGSMQYGMPSISTNITQDIEGTAVSFNETLVRDKDMLCYYAYSTFYRGDQTERQNLLGDKCPTSGTCADRGLPGPETVMWQGREWQRCEYVNNIHNDLEQFFQGRTSYWHAINYCENLELAGHSDWRLPTKDELKSLVVCSNGTSTPLQDKETESPFTTYSCGDWGTYITPTIDPSFSVKTFVGHYHWSVTEAHQSYLAWSVEFGAGTCVYEDKTWTGYARCVR